MKEFLTIGELADIFNMDVQLLRHYPSDPARARYRDFRLVAPSDLDRGRGDRLRHSALDSEHHRNARDRLLAAAGQR